MNKKSAKVDPPPLAEGTISTRAEHKQVEERLAIGANVVYETIRREGEDELHRTVAALAWSALAAGLSMGFSFVAEGLLMSHLPDQLWRPLIASAGYCVGFLIVILGRQQLFTENTLTVVLPLLLRRDLATLLRMLRLWGVVLSGNLVGTFLFALCIGKIVLFRSSHPGIPHTDRSRPHRSKFLDRASACRFRGMADCFNGMAPSRSRIRARQHRHHCDVFSRNQPV